MTGSSKDRGLTLKTAEFTSCMRAMKQALRDTTTDRDIIQHEVGRVVEKSAELTGRADREKIRERVTNRAVFKIDGKTYSLRDWKTGQKWRVPGSVWNKIVEIKERSLTRRLAAVGITKRSWLELAGKFGEDIAVPGYVAAAKVNGDTTGNTRAQYSGSGDRFGLQIHNRHPLLDVPATQGVRAFFAALSGRIKFFEQNMARGVFDKLERVAKKYKGMKVGRR